MWSKLHLSRGDSIAIAMSAVIPTLLYVPLAIAGHPLLPGDDLNQNYPLRVLAGAFIRSGHLPSWDPYIWSGTPLLAGWNAGALYPGTWLFALLPGIAAWTINLVLYNVICATGVFVFLRLLRCGPLAASLGSLCFTYTGFMSGQTNHIGMVQGTGWIPWMLVAIELLARSNDTRSAIWPAVLLSAATAMCILSGEPRAVSSEIIIGAIYLVARAISLRIRGGVRLMVQATTGAALGIGISAIQWLPGLAFVGRSQRTLVAYQAFGTGSLSWITIVRNALVPFLLGSNGIFNTPHYVGTFNLPEVTIGVGLLPLVAACAYLPRLFVQLRRFGMRSGRSGTAIGIGDRHDIVSGERALGVWYLMGAVGIALTLGTSTPLGHLLVKIPLYGGERLQNRNVVITGLALAILLGFFIDDIVGPRTATATSRRLTDPLGSGLSRMLALVPVVGCVGLISLAYLHPRGVQQRLGVSGPSANFFVQLTPYLAVAIGLALAIGAVAIFGRRVPRSVLAVTLATLGLLEATVYVANSSWLTITSSTLSSSPDIDPTLSQLIGSDRYVIFNPLVENLSNDALPMETDLNIIQHLMSVQGYGSIVSGRYQNATNTHVLGSLNPAVLDDGLGNALDLRVLLTLPVYLDKTIPPHSAIPVAGARATVATGREVATARIPSPAPLASGPWNIAPGATRTWFLPKIEKIARVTVVVNENRGDTSAARASNVGIGIGSSGVATRITTVAVSRGSAQLALGSATSGESVTVTNTSSLPLQIGAVVAVTRAPGERLLLDGNLEGALNSPQWSYAGNVSGLSVFVNHEASGLAWLAPRSQTTPGPPLRQGTVTTRMSLSTGAESMTVATAHPALLVRSVASQSGWTAELTPIAGGATVALPVRAFGLVQAVSVPAGRFRVTWIYNSVGLVAGGAITLASLLLFGVAMLLAVLSSRRRAQHTIFVPRSRGPALHPSDAPIVRPPLEPAPVKDVTGSSG